MTGPWPVDPHTGNISPPPVVSTAEYLARRFHEAYERLAPSFGYETRAVSAVPWEQVPENNRNLMIAVAAEVGSVPSYSLRAAEARIAELERELADARTFVEGYTLTLAASVDTASEAVARAERAERELEDAREWRTIAFEKEHEIMRQGDIIGALRSTLADVRAQIARWLAGSAVGKGTREHFGAVFDLIDDANSRANEHTKSRQRAEADSARLDYVLETAASDLGPIYHIGNRADIDASMADDARIAAEQEPK